MLGGVNGLNVLHAVIGEVHMKRIVILVAIVAACICTACSGGSVQKSLQSNTWRDVNDGDTYTFDQDGKGKHGENDITYTVEKQAVSVTEGTGSTAVKFTYDDSGDVLKLNMEDGHSYLVPSDNYEEIANKIMEENVNILTTTEFWSSTKATAFLQFMNDGDGKSGTGWTVTPLGTLGMSWKMIDNNTVESEIPGGTAKLTIINDGGSYSLIDDTGTVLYVPK